MLTNYLNHSSEIIFTRHLKHESVSFIWGNYLELIWQLDGTITSESSNGVINVPEKSLCLNNPYTAHSINAAEGEAIVFYINFDRLSQELIEKLPPRFYGAVDDSQPACKRIKMILAKFLSTDTSTYRHYDLFCESIVSSLLFELAASFASYDTERSIVPSSVIGRLESILKFIAEHSQERLSLQNIANNFFISPQYISRIFRELLGMSYFEYITDIRLNHTVPQLLNSALSLERIADSSGFANSRAYADAFRRKYQMLPSEYRRQYRHDEMQKNQMRSADYDKTEHLPLLAEAIKDALGENLQNALVSTGIMTQSLIHSVDIATKGTLMSKGSQKIILVNLAKELVFSSTQNLLREAQHEIGFDFVNFHGLLDDSMKVYFQEHNGRISLNFSFIDIVFDFILSLNLKPIVELSYMPKAMAASPVSNWGTASFFGMPKNMRDWNYMIKELVVHLQKRYGEKILKEWPFSVWSQPDNLKSPFGFENRTDFFELFHNTFQTIKSVDPDIQVGTPALMSETLINSSWFADYFEFCKSNQCTPDYINLNLYSIRVDRKAKKLLGTNVFRLTDNPDAIKNTLTNIAKWNVSNHWNFKKYNIMSWNYYLGWDLLADTMYRAVYLVKNAVDNYPGKFNFALGTLSDFSDENITPEETFHGGMGLYTKNEIRKPSFYAYKLLNKLGTAFIDKGDGFLITKTESGIQIMLFHYQHYSKDYIDMRFQNRFAINRYDAFDFNRALNIHLTIKNLDVREYLLTETILNRKHGSSYDNWIESGGMPLCTPEEVNYIKAISIPFIHKETLAIADGSYHLRRELEPLEIRLIELTQR